MESMNWALRYRLPSGPRVIPAGVMTPVVGVLGAARVPVTAPLEALNWWAAASDYDAFNRVASGVSRVSRASTVRRARRRMARRGRTTGWIMVRLQRGWTDQDEGEARTRAPRAAAAQVQLW